jgi:hypothetical protein
MRVIVPTYRRHSNGEAQTFEHVPKDFPLTLVVRAGEADAYEEMRRRLGRDKDDIWVIPEGAVSGIATTRQWIIDSAIEMGNQNIVMLDDDLHFIVRGKIPEGEPGWDYKLRPCDEQDFREMIQWLRRAVVRRGYFHAAVSMREGNNRTPGIGAEAEATRGIRAVAYSLEPFRRGVPGGRVRFREEVEGREDLDVSLQLMRRGLPNLVTFHWAQGHRAADAPGGLSGSRPLEQLDSTAEKLAELHPDIVRTRTKTNKSGPMAGERTEVTIYWKKAVERADLRPV